MKLAIDKSLNDLFVRVFNTIVLYDFEHLLAEIIDFYFPHPCDGMQIGYSGGECGCNLHKRAVGEHRICSLPFGPLCAPDA